MTPHHGDGRDCIGWIIGRRKTRFRVDFDIEIPYQEPIHFRHDIFCPIHVRQQHVLTLNIAVRFTMFRQKGAAVSDGVLFVWQQRAALDGCLTRVFVCGQIIGWTICSLNKLRATVSRPRSDQNVLLDSSGMCVL